MQINPIVLHRRRREMALSLEDLESRSKISRTTIHRIERGKTARSNQHTVNKLAAALKLDPATLTASPSEADKEAEDLLLYSRSQLNVRISHEARNALNLVGIRYSIKPTDVLEFAPLLFYIVAEESLRERSELLSSLAAARASMEALTKPFSHLSERLAYDPHAEEIEGAEAKSIRGKDIRGRNLDDDDPLGDNRPHEYEDGEENPFVVHLRKRLQRLRTDTETPGEVEAWHDGWAPRYQICHRDALNYLAGDSGVADAIINGVVGLHEIPKELRPLDQAEARVAFIKERIAETAARQVALLEELDLGVLR